MKYLYKISLLLLMLLPTLAMATDPGTGKYTKSKKLSKSFTVNKTCMVHIENEFGSVTITTWNEPRVAMDIMVEVSGDDEENVDRQLREIDVNFEASASRVSAETDTDYSTSRNNSWTSWFSGAKNEVSKIKIDYIVKMPATSSLDVSNDYGAIVLDRLEGQAKIKCDFGRLDIGQLLAENNELRFDYTKSSHIDYMKSGTIRADFSSFDLHGCERVEFKGDYTKGNFHNTNDLNFNGDFSTLESEEVNRLVCRGDYSTIRLGKVHESVNLNTDFGSINIAALQPGFKEAIVRSDYTGVTISYHPDAEFSFEIDTEFAGIKLSEDLNVTRSEKDSTDKRKSGYAGGNGSGGIINIKSSFGGVSLKSN
ncbi:hypothetical protein [Nonlabens xiamenensis]|uniref:hypothetical protein n=1 Tax=Nonlabens xiamenensis TaxID=2341043 RepID=UPI000F607E32|nr:hypothetical protein [Nonlabens xiamenensis]